MQTCKYGPACYRKNPAHFAEFAHPWLAAQDEPPESSGVAGSPKPAGVSPKAPSSPGPSPKARAPHKKDAARDSLMSSVYVGLANAWTYRANGKARVFVVLDEDLMEEFGERSGGKPLLLSNTKHCAALLSELRHGDVVDFGDYRGCGAFVAEPVDNVCSDFYLWKTIEEMGYGLPPCFGDSPPDYYAHTSLSYVFRSTQFIRDKVGQLWCCDRDCSRALPI
jgi:hypothetical protein